MVHKLTTPYPAGNGAISPSAIVGSECSTFWADSIATADTVNIKEYSNLVEVGLCNAMETAHAFFP